MTSMLSDQNNALHSIEIVLFRVPMLDSAIGGGSVGFTFENSAGKTLYLWTNYGNKEMMADFPVGEFNATPAGDGKYNISVTPFPFGNQNPGFNFVLQHDPADTNHIAGELNAKYILTANGIAQVGAAQNNLQLVQYSFQGSMTDQRGLMPEGYGGYVGPVPGQTVSANVSASWELALPQLALNNWKMTISPVGKAANNAPIQKPLEFENATSQKNIMWLDRQVLYPSAAKDQTRNVSGIQSIAQSKQNGVNAPSTSNTTATNSQQLYHGTWMSFCLNKGAYKGHCGDIVAFWQSGVTTAAMDSDHTATGGFMNLFLPNNKGEKNPPQPGGVITESLSFAKGTVTKPYRIKNDPKGVYTSPVSGNHYAQIVYVTLRRGTIINAALNHRSAHAKEITLRFQTLSQQTENVMLANSDAFYEGAATVSVCEKHHSCQPIGAGFVEQMGYSQ